MNHLYLSSFLPVIYHLLISFADGFVLKVLAALEAAQPSFCLRQVQVRAACLWRPSAAHLVPAPLFSESLPRLLHDIFLPR